MEIWLGIRHAYCCKIYIHALYFINHVVKFALYKIMDTRRDMGGNRDIHVHVCIYYESRADSKC